MKRRRARHCHYCGRLLAPSDSPSHLAETRDHIVPVHQGGRSTVPCCRQCNNVKGGMSLREWREFMAINPMWWRSFRTSGCVSRWRQARRAEMLAARPRAPMIPAWPRDVTIPRRPLCRGLP